MNDMTYYLSCVLLSVSSGSEEGTDANEQIKDTYSL